MAPRQYRLGKRAVAVEETQRRIVLAAVALHKERGIGATTMKDIASRADVSEGTVYHHFPVYLDLIKACGAHLRTVTRPPTVEVLSGKASLEARIGTLVREVFTYYQRYPQWERVRCDADRFPGLEEAVRRREEQREPLVREALAGTRPSERRVKLVMALTDFAVYRSLTQSGMSNRAAARQVSEVILAWLARAST